MAGLRACTRSSCRRRGGTRKTIEAGIAAVQEMLPRGQRRHAHDAFRRATSWSACSAAAPTASRPSPRIRRSARRWTSSCATAARASCPRRRRSTASSTRSRGAPPRARSARSWSSASAGGRTNTRPGRDVQINGRVSPGNQDGGLANIFEKSLGSSMKGGTGPLMEVYRYAEPVTHEGIRVHGHARLRSVLGHRADRGRREPDRVHDRPRLDVRLEAGALHQARDQHADVPPAQRGHGHELRRDPRRRLLRAGDGARASSSCCCAPPRARRARASCSGSATTSSCPGRSACGADCKLTSKSVQ